MKEISPAMEQAVRGLTKPQLQGMLESMQAELRSFESPAAPAPAARERTGMLLRQFPPAPVQPDLAPASPTVVSPRLPEHPVPRGGFVEEIDDSLANATEPTGKVFVTPQALALHLQKLRPQDASLQNINIEILNGRSVQAKGKISKMGTSDFVVDLGADQDGGELKVVSRGLTNVARTHKGHTGEINQALGDILSTLQKKLDEDIADKTWHATGFSVSPDHQELVINFENGERMQAREEFQRAFLNLRDRADQNNLPRPTLTQLAEIILKEKGEDVSPEYYANVLREQFFAAWIEKGRINPRDPMVQELFGMLDEGEAKAIKAIVEQKLAAAADQPWASAWKSYLIEPVANQNIPPEIAGDEELAEEYRKALKEGDPQQVGELFEAVKRWAAAQNPPLPFNREAFERFYEAQKQ